jgi:hypothetical protein
MMTAFNSVFNRKHGTTTLFRWEQDGNGGDHGTLVLWPDTERELRMTVESFRIANTLGMSINGVTKEAFRNGRQSMKDEVALIKL